MSYGRPTYNTGYRDDRRSDSGNELSEILKPIKEASDLGAVSIEDIAKPDGIAEKFVKQLKNDKKRMNPTQLRKYFDNIVKIKEKISESGWQSAQTDYYMLYPTLAYAKGRETIPENFYTFCTVCLDKIPSKNGDKESEKNFYQFAFLMESVIAYAKYHGISK